MFLELLSVGFLTELQRADEAMAESLWGTRCPRCGKGILHVGDYQRNPRGHPPEWKQTAGWNRRASLCCSAAGCRMRVTPPSRRFLGRKVYLAPIVAVAPAAGADFLARVRQYERHLDRHTVARWRAWWLVVFVALAFWKILRGSLMPPVDEGRLPDSLIERFGRTADGVRRLLVAIAPVTTATCQVREGRAM